MFGHTGPFSYSPRGFPLEDFPQQRRTFLQEDLRGSPLQRNMFRPSGKSIYMQRKEYADVLSKRSENLHVRVEHLFTCELDGRDLRTVGDCVAKLKRLDAKGRLWPQEMIMETQGGYLMLSDIETKAELEALPLGHVVQTKAVLDSCAYNSLLTVTVEERRKRLPQVYMFQCEETGAEVIKSDLDKAVQMAGGDVDASREQSEIRPSLGNIIGHHALGNFRQPEPHPVQREWTPPPPVQPAPQWRMREPETMPIPRVHAPQTEIIPGPDLIPEREFQSSPEIPLSVEENSADRNTEIFNHVINDVEIFMNKVSDAVTAQSRQENKSKKKIKFKKKKKNVVKLPSIEEYISCLQKIKYGFNLLGLLEGSLSSPTAPDFVHIFFSSLSAVVHLYPADVPSSVLTPLLTVKTIRLISQAADPEEDQLWKSLGDSWNVPRSRWPNDVPPYFPHFYDGWQLPAPIDMPSPPPYQNSPASTRSSQRLPPDRPRPDEPITSAPWSGPPPTHPSEQPTYMKVIYDFMARNNQELSIFKGDVVQVIQKSKQWWLVRNERGEEGNVPQNVLEPDRGTRPMEDLPRDTRGSVTLDMNSTPAEVKAWLEYKGFSRITVSTLGVLTGTLLLGMTKDEIRTVCPEEGGKVFFQLQAFKSAIALASEQSGWHSGRY
ncbi:epidermal growth factor receptor kinase substrate 8-like protein 3b [Antennarius striatus]|uniref:epidermal growth factor receptor kinase substrate 8-like protein 3b n=1 Tax=Antennarius striatus TaxID=241820 RepID=UPI0035B2D006